jgi:hypothetical protein
MPKTLVMVILVLLASVLPIDREANGEHPGGDQNHPNSTKQPATPPRFIVECEVKQETSAPECDWAMAKPDGYFTRLSAPENAPNAILCAVAVVGIIIAICTLRAANRSIRLQETAYLQWVALTNWRVDYIEDRQQMRIRVEIVNQTQFPLTLNRASLIFGTRPNITTASLGQDFFLGPRLPYTVDISQHVYNDELDAFGTGYYGVSVEGTITHTGVLRRPKTQQIGGILVSGRASGARFDSYVPMHPKDSQQGTDG